MANDSRRRRWARWLGWSAIGVLILFWAAPIGLLILVPPTITPSSGEGALVGVAAVVMLLGAVGMTGTVVSGALALCGLYFDHRSWVARVALGVDIAVAAFVLYLYFS